MPRKSQTLHVNLTQCAEHKRSINQTRFINSCSHETLRARRRYDEQMVLIACAIFGMEVFGSPFLLPKSLLPIFASKSAISTVFPNRFHIYNDELRTNKMQFVHSRMTCSFYHAINKHTGSEFVMVQREEKCFS